MKHYLNLNYLCNEHCVFCASDLTNNLGAGVRKELTLEQILAWIAERRPRRGDEVLLAGGEPTLHRRLFEIVRGFAAHCRSITLFTNGIKLADREYARESIAAGISEFQIALFGATPETHDAITRRRGSFDKTIAALNNLTSTRRRKAIVVVRLLVARQCLSELPDIVRAVHRHTRGVDMFSIHRLILSNNARDAEAMVSWTEAGPAINEAARLIREYGFELWFWPVPLCVYRGEIAALVEREVRRRRRRRNVPSSVRYLDPLVGCRATMEDFQAKPAVPEVCKSCRYNSACGGIEDWYYERFGAAGLGLDTCVHA